MHPADRMLITPLIALLDLAVLVVMLVIALYRHAPQQLPLPNPCTRLLPQQTSLRCCASFT